MKMIKLECGHCGEEFEKSMKVYNRDYSRNNGSFYCSSGCSSASQVRPKISKNCLNCENEMLLSKRDITRGRKFCSVTCSNSYRGSFKGCADTVVKRSGGSIRKTTDKSYKIVWDRRMCEEVFEFVEKEGITAAMLKYKKADREIYKVLFEEFGKRPVIINKIEFKYLNTTKKELFDGRKNWQSARSGIQRKSRNRYISSGKPLKCKCCGYDKHVDIAHINSVSSFPDDATVEEMTDPNNLVALCPNHHREFDNGLLTVKP